MIARYPFGRLERRRLFYINQSPGYILPEIEMPGCRPYIIGLCCGQCGRRYRRRVSDLLRHLKVEHGIPIATALGEIPGDPDA